MKGRGNGAIASSPHNNSKKLAYMLNVVLAAILAISMVFLPSGNVAFATAQSQAETPDSGNALSQTDSPEAAGDSTEGADAEEVDDATEGVDSAQDDPSSTDEAIETDNQENEKDAEAPVADEAEGANDQTEVESVATKAAAIDTSAPDNDQPAPEPVAKVGSTTFTKIQTALKAAKDGDTVILLKDIDVSGTKGLNITNKTLDLNGHTVAMEGAQCAFVGSNSTIKNGSFDSKDGAIGLYFGGSPESDNAVLEDLTVRGGINVYDALNVVIRNVNVDVTTASDQRHFAVTCDINSSVVIESGTYKTNGSAILGFMGMPGMPCNMQIEGGDFYTDNATSDTPLAEGVSNNELVITGGTYPDGSDAEQYVDESIATTVGNGERFTVREKGGEVSHDDNADTLDPQLELVTLKLNDDENARLASAAKEPAMKAELDKAGGTDSAWSVNVVLRDKDTMVEHHDVETTWVVDYPDDVDTSKIGDYVFKVMHLKPVEKDGATSEVHEIIADDKVSGKADGLHVTSTLSPFTISYKYAPKDTNQGNGDSKPAVTPPSDNEPTSNDNGGTPSSSSGTAGNQTAHHKADNSSKTPVAKSTASTSTTRAQLPVTANVTPARNFTEFDYFELVEIGLVPNPLIPYIVLGTVALIIIALGTTGLILVRRREEQIWSEDHPLPRE